MLRLLRCEKGQSAIFVALMFNVLFVFFAMSINVAMVIHDKINLQNSVDLGAYYAAQKQAEILNAMAHQNYAIRQSWKLLSWRYRVLGTMGTINPRHPATQANGPMSNSPYRVAEIPTICMTYKPTWEEAPPRENPCQVPNFSIPPLPQVRVIAGFIGANHGIAALSRHLRELYRNRCDELAGWNWWFGASILHAFRVDQRNRRQVIYGLASGLSAKKDDFTDIDGGSVLEGVRQTIQKNLTHANRSSLVNIELFNSMADVPVQNWLSDILIAPTLYYTDVDGDSDGCRALPTHIVRLPKEERSRNLAMALGGDALVPWIETLDGFIPNSDFQFSMGVEKNPWVMPYVGVKVETNPRQVFYPVAGALKTVARAFAKPFGGRMGPWHGNKWDRGALKSEGRETDPLLPPRMNADGSVLNSIDQRRLPNYSRYPGDTLGMIANMSQNALANLASMRGSLDFYRNIKADIQVGGLNDVLAWDGVNNSAPRLRDFELAAIAPDLYDITYYSIEPNFTQNYWERINANKFRLGIPSDVPVRPDLGHNSNIIPHYNVQQQMASGGPLQKQQAFYFVRNKTHLLTSWLPGPSTYNYDAPIDSLPFGRCALDDDDFEIKNPGSCIAGGRTGYSVKLVSRDYLLSNQIQAGGPNAAPNAINNPPPSGW